MYSSVYNNLTGCVKLQDLHHCQRRDGIAQLHSIKARAKLCDAQLFLYRAVIRSPEIFEEGRTWIRFDERIDATQTGSSELGLQLTEVQTGGLAAKHCV